MRMYWLDLETTGLDPQKDQILEVAVAEASFTSPFDAWVIYDRPLHTDLRDDQLSPFILDLHTRNGLLADCRKSTLGYRNQGVGDIEQDLLALIPEAGKGEDLPTLAGSSVHFDHEFLKHHMPTLAKRFSHRHYDVSAVKLFCQSLRMPKIPKAEAHRALADVRESIAHAVMCKDWLSSHFINGSVDVRLPEYPKNREMPW